MHGRPLAPCPAALVALVRGTATRSSPPAYHTSLADADGPRRTTLTLQKTNEEDDHLQVNMNARRTVYGAGSPYRAGRTLSRPRWVRCDPQKQPRHWPCVCSPAMGHGLGCQAWDGERSAVPGMVPRRVAGVVPHPAGRLATDAPAATGGVAVLLPARGVLS